MGTATGLAPSSIPANAPQPPGGLSMQQGARPCLPGNWDISVRTGNILSMQSGRDSAALKSGTAMTGENACRITPIVVGPAVNGLQIICSAAAGGSGSFHCAGGTSVT